MIWFQVKRLNAAIRKEDALSTTTEESNSTIGKKRERENKDRNNEESKDEISVIDKFQAMNVQNLRKEAILRGISPVGTKIELVERLCSAATSATDGFGISLTVFFIFF